MTRKDYVAIAAALARRRQHFADNLIGGERSYSLFTCTEIAGDIADVMARENPRFDRARFLKDCGVLTDNERLANAIFGEVKP